MAICHVQQMHIAFLGTLYKLSASLAVASRPNGKPATTAAVKIEENSRRDKFMISLLLMNMKKENPAMLEE